MYNISQRGGGSNYILHNTQVKLSACMKIPGHRDVLFEQLAKVGLTRRARFSRGADPNIHQKTFTSH